MNDLLDKSKFPAFFSVQNRLDKSAVISIYLKSFANPFRFNMFFPLKWKYLETFFEDIKTHSKYVSAVIFEMAIEIAPIANFKSCNSGVSYYFISTRAQWELST